MRAHLGPSCRQAASVLSKRRPKSRISKAVKRIFATHSLVHRPNKAVELSAVTNEVDIRRSARHQVRHHLTLEQGHEFGLQVGVVVRDVQADDALFRQLRAETLAQLVAMHRLHHEDQLGPGHEFRRQRHLGAMVRARRRHVDARPVREHLLRGRAAQPVAAADEKDVLQRVFLAGLRGLGLSMVPEHCFAPQRQAQAALSSRV